MNNNNVVSIFKNKLRLIFTGLATWYCNALVYRELIDSRILALNKCNCKVILLYYNIIHFDACFTCTVYIPHSLLHRRRWQTPLLQSLHMYVGHQHSHLHEVELDESVLVVCPLSVCLLSSHSRSMH